MAHPLRLASLGVGRIVERGLLTGLRSCDDVELVALASQRPGAAQELAGKCGVDAVDGYEAVLADGRVNAVYIPARGDQHGQWTIAAAEAGKHVLCEKPLSLDVPEAEAMVAACRGANVILMEAFMWRHHPRSLWLASELRSEAAGTLRTIHVAFGFNIDPTDWRLDPAQAGGSLYDVGCYGINAARLLTGSEPTAIDADAHWSASGVDLTTRVGLTFPGGVQAAITCSFESTLHNSIRVVTSNAEYVVDDAFLPPSESAISILRDGSETAQTKTFGPAEQYAEQLRAFAASVRAGALQWPAEDGLANMKVLVAALQSAKRNREDAT